MNTLGYDRFENIRSDVFTNLNDCAIQLFKLIFEIKRVLLFLEKLKAKGVIEAKLEDFKDFEATYGVHSSGPHVRILPPGEEKLHSLGLTQWDIVQINSLGYDIEINLSYWIFLRQNFDQAVKLATKEYEEELNRWRNRREHPISEAQNIFLENLLPEDVRKATFYPEKAPIEREAPSTSH